LTGLGFSQQQTSEQWGQTMTKLLEPPSDLWRVERILDFTLGSKDASELCRRFVHGTYHWGEIQGAYLYLLDNRSNLVEVAGYGVAFIEGHNDFSIWNDNVAGKAVREKQLVQVNGAGDHKYAALPLMFDDIPNGCLVLVMTAESDVTKDGLEIGALLSKLGGYYIRLQVANGGLGNTGSVAGFSGGTPEGSPLDMTTRQLQILGMMAEGLTNAEIALRILLSESTVRQETIRIYRSLGVNNRADATAKGRLLGIIPKIAAGSTPPRDLVDSHLK
jgi:DNA-binding CsgD family transcriptional regulator